MGRWERIPGARRPGDATGPAEAETIPVILCTWQRPERFAATVGMLAAQTHADLALYVWNNNPALAGRMEAMLASVPHAFDTMLHHHPANLGPIARTHVAHELARERRFRYAVTIDDDQELPPDFLATLAGEARERTISSAHAYCFRGARSYWDRVQPEVHQEADYCGTGGAIFDIGLFADPAVLAIPRRYRMLDDLWLSYFARGRGWRLQRSAAACLLYPDDGKGLYRRLAPLKDAFRRRLERKLPPRWRVRR